ncbi:thermonuclease family protein [Novosphingobium sp. YJ-S2-02]|uniref:Thermonuclease family protein n=1 Tax=Novosphingobium aureum TaxID=2792964 RepID=A0A931HGW9_9SPHN|nr:thermonuclease family protein [Novosphingobium aureum]MBH0115153.1 thermonuclease family protein [Novosphingobium aureum]
MLLFILAAAGFNCSSPKIHDGDTLRCERERIRIADIDAPELPGSPSCSRTKRLAHWCDYALGKASRDALIRFVGNAPVTITRLGTDRYGRTLARVSVRGRDVGQFLVSQRLARAWR